MKKRLRVLELFGGIGACSKALERLGIDYEIADYVEIDKYAVKSFNAMHNTDFEPQDICTWDKNIEVDLIMHGSPCQDFSVAGKGAGGDEGSGTRSSLMYETIRIVEKLKPKYVIWENVKNLLSKKHKHNFDAYLETMEQMGYTNYYQVLNAKDYGIPQNRERVFTISILGNENFEFPPKQELKLKLKDILENEVDEKYYLSDEKIKMISNWNCFEKPFKNVYGKNSTIGTLTTRSGAECGGLKVYSADLEDTANLQCNNSMGVVEKSRYSEESLKRIKQNIIKGNVANTLTANAMQSFNHNNCALINSNLRIRKLTPKECWRLMGFDDEDFEKVEKVNSNTQLYKQAGNSIVVNVLEAIFKELLIK